MGWLMFSRSHAFFRESKEPLANEYLQVKYFLENFDLVVRTRSHVSFILCVFLMSPCMP